MVIDELIEEIQERFRKGQRRHEIKEDLMSEGYDEDDIEDTIAKIQHDVIKQLPGISWIYQRIEHFESKPNAASPQNDSSSDDCLFCISHILAGVLYFYCDPFGTRSGDRDVKRQSDATIIENGLGQYFQKNSRYPDKLG